MSRRKQQVLTDEQLTQAFAAKIVEFREMNGWSQAELARRLECSPAFLCDYEKGRRNPALKTIQKFSQVLGVPMKVLVTF